MFPGKASEKAKITCLLPECDESHKIKECPKPTPEDVKKYLKIYFEGKKEKKPSFDSIKSFLSIEESSSSIMFSASFLGGAFKTIVMAVIGSDDKIMPPDLLDILIKASPE